MVRREWCSWNAKLIELPPSVSLEDILGPSAPTEMIGRFHSQPDEMGIIDWWEVNRCPIRHVDSSSPYYDPAFFEEVFEAVGVINMGAPLGWIPSNPSGAFRDALIMLKSEQDSASFFRSKHSEEW